ncbi:hypothetical protein M3583_23555, partial [Bacillus subtilis]|nr:hypothetical protein [Bacillus subtilis]
LFDRSIFTGIDVASDGPGRVAAGNYVVRHGRTFFRRMFVSPGARGLMERREIAWAARVCPPGMYRDEVDHQGKPAGCNTELSAKQGRSRRQSGKMHRLTG